MSCLLFIIRSLSDGLSYRDLCYFGKAVSEKVVDAIRVLNCDQEQLSKWVVEKIAQYAIACPVKYWNDIGIHICNVAVNKNYESQYHSLSKTNLHQKVDDS